MAVLTDPDIIIGELAVAGLTIALAWRALEWIRTSPRTPDPWDADVEKQLDEPDAREVCHHCFTPRSPDGWFCEHCGRAVGPYNNLMPFVCLFSEGEVLRNGVNGRMRRSPLIIIGYLLLSLSAYVFFAPIYWIFLFENLRRQPAPVDDTETITIDPPA